MTSEVPRANWLEQEFRSESTLPLLNFLLCTKPEDPTEVITKHLQEVTAGIGKQKSPIPDESKQVELELLRLMKDGPGKVTDNPTVSPYISGLVRSILSTFRSLSLEPVFLACVPGTS